jgi:hypothetical protein
MIVREVTIATATTIEDEVRVLRRGTDHVVEVGARIGTGVGVAVPGVRIGTKDDRPREAHLRLPGTVVGMIHVRRPLVVPGDRGRTRPPLGGILEATGPCRRLVGVVHPLLSVATAVAPLVASTSRIHHQGRLQGRVLPPENVTVPLPPALRCR